MQIGQTDDAESPMVLALDEFFDGVWQCCSSQDNPERAAILPTPHTRPASALIQVACSSSDVSSSTYRR